MQRAAGGEAPGGGALGRSSSGGGAGAHPLRRTRTGDASRQLWLDAWADPVAGAGAYGGCVATCNLYGDGDWRLVVADVAEKKLKVWKGTQRASEHALLDTPVALVAFVPDAAPPRLPALAVAAGPHVYIFKGLKPFYKFTLPLLPVTEEEEQLWQQLDAGTLSPAAGCAALAALRDGGAPLSSRGVELLATLAAGGDAAAAAFAVESRGQPLGRQSSITCMDTIKQAVDDPDAASCLVLGTEDGRVLVLNVAGTAVQHAYALGSAPSFLSASGTLEAGYKLSAATRDGRLHALRGGEAPGAAVQLEAQPVGLVRIGNSVLVATMADVVHCYGGKGGTARQYSLQQPAPVQCLQLLAAHTSRPTKCLLVALANGEVRVYHERSLVSVHTTPGGAPVAALAFGRYAREDNTLVTVLRGGGIDIKIMPRTANFESSAAPGGPPPEQDVPLPVPAKTRLYVEQTQRERDGAVDMHRHFQRDLVRARLATARALVKVLTDGEGAASHAVGASLSLSAAVEGLGPRFRLLVLITNEGAEAVGGLVVVLHYVGELYSTPQQQLPVPLLVPMLEYQLRADVRCLQPGAGAGDVRLTVVAPAAGGGGGGGGGRPLMSARVRMPLSEPDEL